MMIITIIPIVNTVCRAAWHLVRLLGLDAGPWPLAPGVPGLTKIISHTINQYDMYMYVYIYIYTKRERERERSMYVHIYIYIYIYNIHLSLSLYIYIYIYIYMYEHI